MKVCVIIPTFNRPELLARAVRSVQAQTMQPHEIIVVNDGEVPVTVSGARIRVLKSAGRQGCGAARTLAISQASYYSDAFCYLDDDDELLPNHLSVLAPILDGGKKFAFSKALYRYPDFETTNPEPSNPNGRYYDPSVLLQQNIAPVSSWMHTRDAFEAVGGFDHTLLRLEDWDLWARMFIHFGQPGKSDEVTNVIYKGLGENMTDHNPFAYSLMCSWRDIVSDRIKYLSKKGRGKITEAERTMFNPPRVAVVMPCHNSEKFLVDAMESILSQTFRDFEIIAINDGSSDSTGDALRKYSSLDKRVRVFDTGRNVGVSAALNLGLRCSRSALVARMDSDDVSMPDRFMKQVSFLDANPDVGVVGSSFLSMDESLEKITWTNNVETGDQEIRAALRDRCCIGHPTVMMRRRVVESVGGYDETPEFRAVEDYDLWVRAASRFKMANLPDILLKHRGHPSQVTNSMSAIQKANAERVSQKARSLLGGKI